MNQLKELVAKYCLYVVTQPKNKLLLSFLDIPFETQFINGLSAKNAEWYKQQISDLNLRVFGPQSMPSEAWVDAHFGLIGGATIGLMEKNSKKVVSMARFVGHLQLKNLQMWTLMTDPSFQGKGIGKATLAVTCALNKNKEKLTFLTQIENNANRIYLKFITAKDPLRLIGIGFHHSNMPHTLAAEATIPKKPFDFLLRPGFEEPKINSTIFLDAIKDMENIGFNETILLSKNSHNIEKLSNAIANNLEFKIVNWFNQQQAEKLFKAKGPLLAIQRIKK